MSTVQEIEAAIPSLQREEIEALRAWIDDYLEDQLQLTDEVERHLDHSRQEIAAGEFDVAQGRIYLHYVGHRRDIYQRS